MDRSKLENLKELFRTPLNRYRTSAAESQKTLDLELVLKIVDGKPLGWQLPVDIY